MMGQQHRLASETPFDAIQMAFRWRTDDGPGVYRGIWIKPLVIIQKQAKEKKPL